MVFEHMPQNVLSLYEQSKEGKLSSEEVRRLVLQLCLALDHLHEQDIIHRDLKPENLLVQSADKAGICGKSGSLILKLCDFGQATYDK